MTRRILWIIPFVAGLTAGGAALWWMFDVDEPFGTGASENLETPEIHRDDGDVLAKPAPPPTDYVGSQRCRECHREIWERYQTHPMSHSLFRTDETEPPEDYEHNTTFTAGQRQYRVERTPAEVRHHESVLDATGETIYDQAVDVQYAVGSAKRGRSYFIDRGGLLFMSPISWYSEQGQGKWDLSPNYAPTGHLRFERRIVDACVACHSGAARPRPGAADCFESPPFAELSIGCERCHGPGGKHAELRRSGHAATKPDPIVNPVRLDSSRRDAVCYQCHLLGQERVLQYGRTDFDFRPGMHLGEVWAVLVEGTGVTEAGSTEAVSQAEQMLASRCYQATNGKLGCVSCHDPHYSPVPAEQREFYRTKCLACHSERGCTELSDRRERAESDSCVVCHMPRLNAKDVPHTSQTDHRVQRHKSLRAPQPRAAADPDSFQLFESGTPGLTTGAERRARGILMSILAERQHDARLAARVERLLEPFSKAAPDDLAVLSRLAVIAAIQRKSAVSEARWNSVLAVSADNETALESLALQAIGEGRQVAALSYLERYLAVVPWNATLQEHRSRMLSELGRDAEALAAARLSAEIDPSRPEIYRRLSALCSRTGHTSESRRYQDLLRRTERLQGK